jgi:GNAT superfamily N-acetyltransferase
MRNLNLNIGQNGTRSRSVRRERERKFKKGLSKSQTLIPNYAFKKIQPELVDLGWIVVKDFCNIVVFGSKFSMTNTPALKLNNDIFNMTLISHENGIEISRLEVLDKYQNQGLGGKFLDNLILFLNKMGVREIYVDPGTVWSSNSNQSLSSNKIALESFYRKRGFLKREKNPYWMLDVNSFLSFCAINRVDQLLLSGSIQKKENS